MTMFSRVKFTSKTSLCGIRSLHNFTQPKSISQAQLIKSIETSIKQNHPRQPFLKSLVQITSIIVVSALSTIGVYSAYQVAYKKDKAFIPLWINSHKRSPKPGEIDLKQIQELAEDQLLERLSLDEQIKQTFKLPLIQESCSEFDVWIEEKYPSLKGLQISPDSPFFKITNKPIKVKKIFDQILEPVGGALSGEPDFKIPVYNQHPNKEKSYDIVFLGKVPIRGKNGTTAEVVFKGIFDFEHVKHAKILKAHLIEKDKDGKLSRKILWE